MSSDYTIGGGLTEPELRAASFWIRHRRALRRAGYGVLITFIVALWGYTLWSLLDAFAISYPREQRIPAIIASNTLTESTIVTTRPNAIQPSEVFLFQNTGGREDLLVRVTNPNEQWWAEFDYHFDVDGEQTPSTKGYVLPKQQHALTALGWKPKTRGSNAQLVVENVRWHRLDPGTIGRDYAAFLDNRWKITFDDLAYKKDLTVGTQTIGQTSFTLTNASGYGFWNVDLTVILYRGDTPVAVSTLGVPELKPDEKRPLVINWFDGFGAITKTEIEASVNLLDAKTYLPSERF